MNVFYPLRSGHETAEEVIAKTTHLCIAAHEDDVELMNLAVIGKCINDEASHYTACVLTDGAGCPRNGAYEKVTDEEMVVLRIDEQKKAAEIGRYNVLAMFGYSSADVKGGKAEEIEKELAEFIRLARPEVIYTHNLLDRHPTHIGAFKRTLNAINLLKPEDRPAKLIGCEVWGSLDRLPAEYKLLVDSTEGAAMAGDILNAFKSQIAGGKSYDEAWLGRQKANATFSESHSCDEFKNASVYIDMTALIDGSETPLSFAEKIYAAMENETRGLLEN